MSVLTMCFLIEIMFSLSVSITLLTMSVSTTCFLIEIMFSLNAIKFHCKGYYDKQNLTIVDNSYERTGLHKGVFVVPEYVNNILGTNSHI